MKELRKIYKLGKSVIELAKKQGNDYTLGGEIRKLIHKLKL
jgi:hypothetical protein